MKVRVHISVGENFHREAVAYAKARETDFSGLIVEAVRAYMLAHPQSLGTSPKPIPVAVVQCPKPPEPKVPAKPPTPRNSPCRCGSGRKYKKCCGLDPQEAAHSGVIPEGFRVMSTIPMMNVKCPCGSDFMWDACCQPIVPFIRATKCLDASHTVAKCRDHD
jgi:hypothetical protein